MLPGRIQRRPDARSTRFQSQRGIRGGDADEKAMGDKGMESRAEAAEAAMAELEQMRTIAAEQKRKIDGQKARATTLENNNRKMRGEIKVLLKKTTTDDRLIDALREEVAQSRAAVSEMARRLDSVNVSGMSEGEFKKYKGKSESQARQIERQEELITALRAELEQHQSNASTDLVMKAEKDLAIHNKNVDLNLLRVENERLTELSEMFKAKFKSAKANYEGASKKVRELERRAVQLERRLGNINQGGLKRQPPADQFQSLKDRLALQVEENEALKTSFRSALASKDEELRILRTLAEQQQQAYERAVNDVRVQVKKTAGQAQARIIQSQAKNDAQIMEQLAADNDFLRSELRELKAKYREAQAIQR